MGARTLYAGTVWVHYGQIYVDSTYETPSPPGWAFGGQANGLCGAAVPGELFLVTGTHTGHVRFTVEAHDAEPPLAAEWEDVVEASFTPRSSRVVLVEWGGGAGDGPWPLDLAAARDWRVRYCVTGMDPAHAHPAEPGEEAVDRYLLQFWPAPPGPDRVVRQTSRAAAYWHTARRKYRPRPAPAPKEERAEAAGPARREQPARRGTRQRSERGLARLWGGRAPSDRLRTVGGNVVWLARRDRDLLDQLERAEPATQRAIAVWAAHRACEVAGLTALDWVADGLDALDRGEPLPPPLDDLSGAFDRLAGGRAQTRVTLSVWEGEEAAERPTRIDPRYAALPAVPAAAERDPLRAAIDAVSAAAAAFRDDDQRLLGDLRQAFTGLG